MALVEPVLANDQTGTMDQTIMVNSSVDNKTPLVPCTMGDLTNRTMMPCMIMGEYSANTTMMCCMMGEHSANETIMPCLMVQNASISQAGPECARFWLHKAIMLHDLHMRDPIVVANESSKIELMNQMNRAYECITGKNATDNTTVGAMNQNYSILQAGSDCASLQLKKAIELYSSDLTNSTAAANKSSQMVMMSQMIQAYDCIPANKTTIGMCQDASIAQARMDCADFWLQKATEMHKVHTRAPGNRTAQMEIMDNMMRASECIKGERITTGMTNTTGNTL
ncbi:MAG: hypothetical protein EHM20_02700 [Alphaproteobacteria bacterium]|nr:MAG: hypothetical protein EHM20_02700 [Alphaproteobacteria bacterium]